MLIGLVIALVWIAVVGVVVAACRAAARGDAEMARATQQLRRHTTLAGVVMWESGDDELGAEDLRGAPVSADADVRVGELVRL